MLFLLLGIGLAVLFGAQPLHQQPASFWMRFLGVPLLGWCVLGFGRALLYVGQQGVADGWDESRQEDINHSMQRGRRSQQVLGTSLYTGLRERGQQPATQLDALLGGTSALKIQPSRLAEVDVLQSSLPGDTLEYPESVLLRVLVPLLADMAKTLAQLPDDQPLALLLEFDSGLPASRLSQIWQQAWSESGIRQPIAPVEGFGLAAVDHWLDQRIADQALLMVVALQFALLSPEGTAEVAVGLLFGNSLTQVALPPLAYLHRPEEEQGQSAEHLLYAVRQALDWVPLPASSIRQVWAAGRVAQRGAALATALAEVSMPAQHTPAFRDMDGLLGDSGQAAPWLAIAAATQNIQGCAEAQFIFSGGNSVDTGLWCTVLTPATPLST
ncbi:hypothetical protein AABC73_17175 [Pseudomonas sp. G.S.17]|uniref:hypothetical protein n=1 Tax=Pseudomonas sp. G.S.17 TaxID=3137451 RepID=UPI00311C8ADB